MTTSTGLCSFLFALSEIRDLNVQILALENQIQDLEIQIEDLDARIQDLHVKVKIWTSKSRI